MCSRNTGDPGQTCLVQGHGGEQGNLEVRDGEFIILLGPSGCGKSTMLYSIAGLEDITEGELYIGERLVNRVPPKARNIAMVFQDYALYPHMNVYDNMAFSLKLRKASRQEIERRVHEAVTLLGVGQVVALRLDGAALHLFDAETQQAIASPTREPAAAISRQ